LKIIPQVAENQPKAAQNHDARKAVSVLFQSENEVGLYFGLEARHRARARFVCIHLTANQGHQKLI